MVPWPIRRVTDLPPNAKLHEMQQNMHRLVQLIRAATPDVPNQTPSHNCPNKCSTRALYHPCTLRQPMGMVAETPDRGGRKRLRGNPH